MRHLHTGRKLGVAPHHRKALLRSLTLALIEQEEIKTTPARAKELRWFADRIVTLGKHGDLASRRSIVKLLGSSETYRTGSNRVRQAVEKVYSDFVPRFKNRMGGYTQMIRFATRRPGDNAELCLLRYIPSVEEKKAPSKKEDKKKKTLKGAEDKKTAPKTKNPPQDRSAKAR